MRRVINMLAAAVLMVILVSTTVSPAFADGYHNGGTFTPGEKQGWCAKDGEYNTARYCPHKNP